MNKYTYIIFHIDEKTMRPVTTCYTCQDIQLINATPIILYKVCENCGANIISKKEFVFSQRNDIISDLLK